MSTDPALRRWLRWQLRGGHAHVPFEKAVAGLSSRLRGVKPRGLPYSPWMLLEHLRIAQWDIVEYCLNPGHVSPPWPEGYWPKDPAPPTAGAWTASIAAFQRDLRRMERLVANRAIDLLAPIPHAKRHTYLREVLILIDHNAYHIGQLIVVRRVLGAWKDG
ncbi:MAG: DinB family protein [Armatimonadota bacterium]|nr:DinB family protein [Armatimonadota bacterium]